jgi:hypothetical protein
MREIVTGFAVIWALGVTGYVIGRTGLLGGAGLQTLTRLSFFVTAPALLFATLAATTPGRIFTGALAAFVLGTVAVAAVHVLVARLLWRRPAAELTVGALAAGYVNAGNLGIPIAAYVLGDVAFIAPVLMFQVLLAAPAALAVLDVVTHEQRPSWGRIALLPARNPLLLASAAGIAVAVSGRELPAPVLQPFTLLGAAAVPVALLALGMSMVGGRPLRGGPDTGGTVLAVVLKVAVHPLLAYLIGRHALGLPGPALLSAVVTSALPTAQNVYLFAGRFERAEALARDAIVLSTAAAAVTLTVLVALLR